MRLESTDIKFQKVVDQNLIGNLKSSVLGFWSDGRKNNYFPGPLPVSLERSNFFKLTKYPYLICIKSDGTRYMMLLHNSVVYLVDRNFIFYAVPISFKESMITNDSCSLLVDGELVKTYDNKLSYIIHDCICIYGKDVSRENFDERYSNVSEIVENAISPEIVISEKNFYTYKDIDKLAKLITSNKINHKIDGLIFNPATLPIGTHTQFTLFKWKQKLNHTFDFKIIDNQLLYSALVTQGSTSDVLFATVNKNSEEGKMFYNLLKQNCPTYKSSDIVECTYNSKLNTFDPVKIRYDKSHPNNLITVEKTLLNIEEDITFDEIIKLCMDASKS